MTTIAVATAVTIMMVMTASTEILEKNSVSDDDAQAS